MADRRRSDAYSVRRSQRSKKTLREKFGGYQVAGPTSQ